MALALALASTMLPSNPSLVANVFESMSVLGSSELYNSKVYNNAYSDTFYLFRVG